MYTFSYNIVEMPSSVPHTKAFFADNEQDAIRQWIEWSSNQPFTIILLN